MYSPPFHVESDRTRIEATIRDHPFATITTAQGGGLNATHLPFLFDPSVGAHGTLHSHIARANPHWRAFDGKTEALVVFSGPHGYVSPTWYEKHPAVPTWNYIAVHVYGTPIVVEDDARTRDHLAHLAGTFEAGNEMPWRLADQPASFIDGLLKGVVSFAMPVTRIEAKAKLSQNRDHGDVRAVIAALRARGDAALADAMDAAMAARMGTA